MTSSWIVYEYWIRHDVVLQWVGWLMLTHIQDFWRRLCICILRFCALYRWHLLQFLIVLQKQKRRILLRLTHKWWDQRKKRNKHAWWSKSVVVHKSTTCLQCLILLPPIPHRHTPSPLMRCETEYTWCHCHWWSSHRYHCSHGPQNPPYSLAAAHTAFAHPDADAAADEEHSYEHWCEYANNTHDLVRDPRDTKTLNLKPEPNA